MKVTLKISEGDTFKVWGNLLEHKSRNGLHWTLAYIFSYSVITCVWFLGPGNYVCLFVYISMCMSSKYPNSLTSRLFCPSKRTQVTQPQRNSPPSAITFQSKLDTTTFVWKGSGSDETNWIYMILFLETEKDKCCTSYSEVFRLTP